MRTIEKEKGRLKVNYMANLVITPGSVKASFGARQVTGVAGVAISAGQALYLDTDGTYKLAIATTLAQANFKGVALCESVAGQPVVVARRDSDLDLGATLAVGEAYCVSSSTAGAIAPFSDLGTGDFVSLVGVANASDSIYVTIEPGNHSTVAVS